MKIARNLWLLSLLLELILLKPGPATAANINVVWTSEVGQFAPLWITKEAKLFEKYGNQVQLIFIQGASSAAAALSSGDAQVGMFSPQVVVSTPALDLVMFGRLGNTMDNRIYARKGIKASRKSNDLPLAASAATPISPPDIFCSAKDSDQTPMWPCFKSATKPIGLPPSRLTMPRPRCSPRL